ncbi:MAG: NIPSNAP family protein [Proteobacteria bacterium]|nr:NIPSNAP family protein [Pseudomonadota bacterium]
MAVTGFWATGAHAENCAPEAPAPVVELRQYKILPGKRDAMIALFEREFVESQEVVGARLVGQFRDQHDPDRFTWIREFADMDMRERALSAFYFGPVWKAHRNEANALLDDNDNVLLLRPAAAGLDFNNKYSKPRAAIGASAGPAGMFVVNIHYLWKDPAQEFAGYFLEHVRPQLEGAGVPVIGAFVPERTPNNFPRLPVRQTENVFVWFTRAADIGAFRAAMGRATASNEWVHDIAPRLQQFEERPAQVLELAPTPRSALR